MKGKLVGICVCTLVLIVTALSVAATMKSTQASSMELGLIQNDTVVSEAGVLDGRQDDYDWQRSGNHVFTGHGGSYPSGNVGIGTTAPGARLHIKDTTPTIRFEETDQSNKWWHIGGYNSGFAVTETNVADRLYIAAGGNVGIGTVSPSAKLDVEVTSGGAAELGKNTQALGDYSLAAGYAAAASATSSIAMGYGTTASEDYSIAAGYGANAWGTSSIAMGYGPSAMDDYSVALGYFPSSMGRASVALGNYTSATGDASLATGCGTTASEICSTAMGDATTASGVASTAMGHDTIASGVYSTAMGSSTRAIGACSTAFGQTTYALGTFSTAMGDYTSAGGYCSTVMGAVTQANGDYSMAMGRKMYVEGENSVGIGLNDTYNTVEADHVLSIMGGKVGIGTTSPLYLLDVAGGGGLVAQFSGRVKGADAVNDDEFATKSQVDAIVSTHLQNSVMQTRFTPSGTDDPQGNIGDITYDDHYMYVKTPAGWKRSTLETW